MRNALILSLTLLVCASASRAEIAHRAVAYQHDGVELAGYLAWDDAIDGPRPAVLIIHQWWGLGEYEKRRARELAELGYAAFALDMYGRGKLTDSAEQASAWATPFYNQRDTGRSRAAAGLEAMLDQPESDADRVAAIGYCFGGSMVIELAFSGADVAGVVSFHGNPQKPMEGDLDRTAAEILVCHGSDDPLAPLDEVVAFTDALGDAVAWTLAVYGDAQHSFTEADAGRHGIDGVAYQARAEDRSWRHMRAFFDALWE